MKHIRYALWVVSLIALFSLALPVSAQDGGSRVQQGAAFLAANNIPPEAYRDISVYIGTNNQKVAEILVQYGYTPEQAQAFMTPENVFTLSTIVNPGIANNVLGQAYAVIAPYGLSAADLEALLPKLNDPAAMMQTLMGKGLSQEQATQLLTAAAPIIQQASADGTLQYVAISKTLEVAMGQAGIPSNMLFESAHLMNDPERAAAYLAQLGYSDQQVQTFMGMLPTLQAQGITPDLVEGFSIKNAIYRLEGMGLSAQTINDMVALGNLDAVREYLTAQGLSGNELELAMVNAEGVLGRNGEGLTPERLEAFQAKEANTLLSAAGIDPSELGDILGMKDDPEAMAAYLADKGLDESQIAAFTAGLAQSTFAKTVDPDDAEAFAESVQMAADGVYDDPAFFDESDAATGSGDEYSDDEDAGAEDSDEYADDESSDDSGDDSSISEDTGDDSGSDDSISDDSGSSDDSGGADDSGGDSGGESGGGEG